MEEQKNSNLTCQVYGKHFSRVSSKNQHLKKFHDIFPTRTGKHIKCPLCSNDTVEPFGTTMDLIQHLKQFHTLNIKELDLYFRTFEDYEAWRKSDNRDIDYVCEKKRKSPNNGEMHIYNCNRSNRTGPDSKVSDVDGQPYTTILYGNGPGFAIPRIVPMNTTTATEDKNQVHGSAVPRQWGTHGGEDVPVYALGPLATILFTGTFDQSYIPHAIAYSACLGEHRLRCQGLDNYTAPQTPTCVGPDLSSAPGMSVSASGSGAPVVVASSVKADDSGTRTKSGAISFIPVIHLLCLSIGLRFAVT